MALETVAAHTASRAGRASAARAFGWPATERCSISTPRWTVRRVHVIAGKETLLLRVDVAQEF
jgi:hypothetical protein